MRSKLMVSPRGLVRSRGALALTQVTARGRPPAWRLRRAAEDFAFPPLPVGLIQGVLLPGAGSTSPWDEPPARPGAAAGQAGAGGVSGDVAGYRQGDGGAGEDVGERCGGDACRGGQPQAQRRDDAAGGDQSHADGGHGQDIPSAAGQGTSGPGAAGHDGASSLLLAAVWKEGSQLALAA